jgi:glycine/D-amino acid oxidase-like deaminating enzyme
MRAPLLLLLAGCAAPQETPCDVLVVGGSFGGCAAALSAARAGADVWLVEECEWIGGQVTSQGVSALDEHRHIEKFGGTRLYTEFRNRVRAHSGRGNPGGGWVSRLCFEPRVGLLVLEAMLRERGVQRLRARVERAEVRDGTILSVSAGGRRFRPKMVIDATDLGDLLPIVGAPYVVGGESDTGEPHARPGKIQGFTFPFAVEFRPGERHVIPRPEGYDPSRYTLEHFYEGRGRVRYGFFEKRPGTYGSFFDYRKIAPNVALINWPSNDYRGRSIFEPGALEEAKRLSLGFLYWLQTECPRDDGGRGYPELLLRKDLLGTEDGLSMRPYVREGRRIVARARILEQDLGRKYPDSVGIGWYGIDLHACAGDPDDTTGRWIETKPFQIPYGALVPVGFTNLLAGGKNIGTTHVTNGACRVHPVEWAVGEAAGHIAARGTSDLQRSLVEAGIPIAWTLDAPLDHPRFVERQLEEVRRP